VKTISIPTPNTSRLGRLLGGVGASLSILCPKCPICWMILTGSTISGGAANVGVEVAGILLFLFGFYTLLRSRRVAAVRVSLICAITTFIVFAGVWMTHSRAIRILTCGIAVLVSLVPASWMQDETAAHDSIQCFGSCRRSTSDCVPIEDT
jgi:hypothetical protein